MHKIFKNRLNVFRWYSAEMDDDDDDDVMADAEYSPKSMDKKHEEVWTS